jgi:hypothetical protein
MQSIDKGRLELYAEHERLYKLNDRESNEKRHEIFKQLVKLPSVCEVASDYVKDDNGQVVEQVIHLNWRE